MLVDNAAMQLVLSPTQFDVMLTENIFGDILSDVGGSLAGSIGMLPSASLGVTKGCMNRCTARRRTSRDRTKPIRWERSASAAAMLEYTFGLMKEAAAVNAAIGKVLESGRVTADLKPKGKPATTDEVGQAVCEAL